MPNESLSVYLTAVDGISPVFASITDKTKALDKESQELQQTFQALQTANKGLIQRKTELQQALQKVNEEVQDARKSFKELGDEASSDAYEKAQEKQQKLRNEIAATTKALQENQKTYKENIETIRKGSLSESGSGTLSGGTDGAETLSKVLGSLGAAQQLSSLAGQTGDALLSSALGSDLGGLVSGTLSSTIPPGPRRSPSATSRL